ncbi:MAG: carotenoid 1,2-hydratase, partial [Acidobacteria bacterium]|nr:carotenoid 1,2-hydratase [Acidobacteriota bacterium]
RFRLDGAGHDQIEGAIPEGEEKDGHPGAWRLSLATSPLKRPTRHGGDGIIPMSDAGGTSWYYSYTRLEATGSLETPRQGRKSILAGGEADYRDCVPRGRSGAAGRRSAACRGTTS